MTMIEKLEKAAQDAHDAWISLPPIDREHLSLHAMISRAVLTALREPDEGMIAAADEVAGTINPIDAFTLVINHILQEADRD